QQELNRYDIEGYTECAADAVMAYPGFSRHIANRHFRDSCAIEARQCGNKTVQFPIKPHVVENFGAICLERRSEIVEINPGNLRHQPVGDTAGYLSHHQVVHADL